MFKSYIDKNNDIKKKKEGDGNKMGTHVQKFFFLDPPFYKTPTRRKTSIFD